MNNQEIDIMDNIKDGSPCSIAVTKNGYTVAKIENGIFWQRSIPHRACWEVSANRDWGCSIYILTSNHVLIFRRKGKISVGKKRLHFRVDL